MNDAHYHLVINHFPIIGTIFGLGILIAGLVLKKSLLQNTAYVLFIVSALTGFLSMYTGEGAEEMVENFPTVSENIIHKHEELAEKFAAVLYVLGAVSLLTLFLQLKRYSFAKIATYCTLGLALVAVVLGKEVGTSGGEIRHTEIRKNANQAQTNSAEQVNNAEQDED